MGYLIERKNITADNDITYIGKRGLCGENAQPFDCVSSAITAIKRQEKQDLEYCPECTIVYKVVEAVK